VKGTGRGYDRGVREYEIGSEAWMRERIERGLDPAEADRPEDGRLLSFELGGHWPELQPAWSYASGTVSER
jgi:hypothetical protein